MARNFVAHCLLLSLLLLLPSVFSSGNFVGFSYDARRETVAPWSHQKALSFIHQTREINHREIIFLTNTESISLDSLSSSTIPVYLCLNPIESENLLKTEATTISWLKTHLIPTLQSLNITTIVLNSNGERENLIHLHSSLNSLHSSLKSLHLDRRVKISLMISLSNIQTMIRNRNRDYKRIIDLIRKSGSFLLVEIEPDSSTDFITSIPNLDTAVALNVKTHFPLNQAEISKLTDRIKNNREVLGLIFDITHVISKTEESSFHNRDLLDSTKPQKFTAHDIYDPTTNPNPTYATPITVPSTNPSPAVVTVNPTNPTVPPVTIPPINPYTSPVTVPSTNPIPISTTPVTNPTTNPTTYPVTSPVTNPVTTYPYPNPQQGATPTIAPPVTTPGSVPSTVPVSVPSTVPVSGQTWCVAKTGMPDTTLQMALDYACGIGGADCSAIQPMGNCYNPNTMQTHASYAFNSYYQRNPSATSCDFGGAGMIVNVNPSSGTCMYPSSSLATGYSPTPTTTTTGSGTGTGSIYGSGTGTYPSTSNGSGSSSTVLNSGPNSAFGPDNQTSATSTSDSFSLSIGWIYLLFVFTYAYIIGHV